MSHAEALYVYTLPQNCAKVRSLANVKVFGEIGRLGDPLAPSKVVSTLKEVMLQARREDLKTVWEASMVDINCFMSWLTVGEKKEAGSLIRSVKSFGPRHLYRSAQNVE